MGLTRAEIALLLPELRAALADATLGDVVRLATRDDLLLFFTTPTGKRCLHLVPGGQRGRVTLTRRRFPARLHASGPLVDRLAERLRQARFVDASQPGGERRCRVTLRRVDGSELAIELEMFGARGLWCVVDAEGQILELSRLPRSDQQTVRPGARYAPPAARPAADDDAPRFADLAAVDAFFTAADEEEERAALRGELDRALTAAERKLGHRAAGLAQQATQADDAPALRKRADLLLTFGFAVRPGQTELVVADPERDGESLTIPLDPRRTPADQAQALYDRARRLQKALATTAAQLQEIEERRAVLQSLRSAVLAAATIDELERTRAQLVDGGVLREPKPPPPPPAVKKLTHGENFRRFVSAEGYPILVGRSNEQNDRLSLRVARGNDLWFHVGGGRAGSHVVVRLPRGKTASLETMLDAGTLAVHFSKGRGATVCDVVYTQAKHVTKPKGLPAGRVLTHQTRTLRVRHEDERLRRLLDSSATA